MKTKIDVKSFFEKGTKKINDDFLVALICGVQGSGKSYFGVYNIERNLNGRGIKTNVQTLKGVGKSITYFSRIEQIYNDTDDNVVYLIDELSKRYNRNSPIDLPFYSWLQQSRKHKRYVFLITQEYLQVPPWLRGVANLVYTTHKVRFTNFYKTTLGIPVLDKDNNFEWGLDELSSIIYKRTKRIASKYDTFESINTL